MLKTTLSAIFMAVSALSCSHSVPPASSIPTDQIMVQSEIFHVTGGKTVNLLARGFLPTGRTTPAFAHYLYLYFGDRGMTSSAARLSASRAFLRLFDDVSGLDSSAIPTVQLALFVAPIRESTHALSSPQELIDSYDYNYAQILASKLLAKTGKPLPRVALIASVKPLEQLDDQSLSSVSLVALCGDDRTMEDKIIGIRDRLMADAHEPIDSTSMIEQAIAFFMSISSFAEMSLLPGDDGSSQVCP